MTTNGKPVEGRDEHTGRFVTGNKGGGRQKGSRNKLGEQFIDDLYGEWKRSGVEALKSVAKDDPVAFVKVVANILPARLEQTLNVDVDLFIECKTFAEAFRLARDHIGADEPQLIEAEAVDDAD
jgi:hypothetical protein